MNSNTPTPEDIAKEMRRLREADEYRRTRKKVLDGTCQINIVGAPTSEIQCWALQWAFQDCVLFSSHFTPNDPQRLEVIEQQGFSLPYNQGGGKITLTRYNTTEDYEATRTQEDVAEDRQWQENRNYFSGYEISFNYSDSMTSPWASPIYYNEISAVSGNAPFYLNEM